MSEQTFPFEKFMRDLEERERLAQERKKQLAEQEEYCDNRAFNRLYREHPHNRMHVRPKK